MRKQRIKSGYTKFDPAHLFDGLFIPTNGKKRDRLFIEPKIFGGYKVGFQGFEQLGVDDQSVLLAICAQLGINGLLITEETKGEISKELRKDLFAQNEAIATKKTTLRSILIDAGYKKNDTTQIITIALNRLRATQIREINIETGWDRVHNILSTMFNEKTGELYLAVNPRLSGAVLGEQQNVQISLFERNELNSEVAKILHAWLCSNIRLGKSIGNNNNGVSVDALIPHVYGALTGKESRQVLSKRRSAISNALKEIQQATEHINLGTGWCVEQTSNGLFTISRPKKLPIADTFILPSGLEQKQKELNDENWWNTGRTDDLYSIYGVTKN